MEKIAPSDTKELHRYLQSFFEFNRFTEVSRLEFSGRELPVYINEYWTAKQRAGHPLHEVSYRACYKPQLPGFFIDRFCMEGDIVYDPFAGRGTTLIEGQLSGCRVIGNDVNPLSRILAGPRLDPPTQSQVEKRLEKIILEKPTPEEVDSELLVFFQTETLDELYGWRSYFRSRRESGEFDNVDAWIQMVATNRLTGHSPGFFSVYTLPPNQATSVRAQRKINEKRKQSPEYRDTKVRIVKKSRSLLKKPLPKGYARGDGRILTGSADATPQIEADSVSLVVTSPPFLDTVDYVQDNWLRMWFCELVAEKDSIWQLKSIDDWVARMTDVFVELHRILKPDGLVAFEVGEVRQGKVLLEEEVVKAAINAGLHPECIMINSQVFTKTANCWGVGNNAAGTNSNRIVIMRK